MVDLRLQSVSVRDVLLVLHVINVDIVAVATVAKVDISLSVAAVLGNSKSFLVGLVIGAGDHLLIKVGFFVSGTVRVRVLTENDTLSEYLVVSGAAITIVRLGSQVLNTRSVVALVRVAVGTNAVLVVVATVGAVTLLLGALVVGSGRSVLASVAVQAVAMTLSIVVTRAVTTTAVRTVLALASLVAILTAISRVAAVVAVLTVLGLLTVAAIMRRLRLTVAAIMRSSRLVVASITRLLTVAAMVTVVSALAAIAAVAPRVVTLLILTTIAIVAIATVSIVSIATVSIVSIATIAFLVTIAVLVSSVVVVLGWRMKSTGELTTSCDRSAAHNSTVLVLTQLNDLVTLDVLAVCSILVAVARGMDSCTAVVVGAPVAVAEVISITRNPSVDTLGIWLIIRVPVRALLVLTVEGDSGSLRHLLALGMILDNLPVLLDRNIDISELDLSLLSLLNLGQLLPLNGKDQTVTASGIDIGDNPNVLNISSDDFLEGLQGQLLLISPFAGWLISLFVSDGGGLGKEEDFAGALA